jgi:hypothetical protein
MLDVTSNLCGKENSSLEVEKRVTLIIIPLLIENKISEQTML